MDNEDIVNYVMDSPENTNPAVLRGMLGQLNGGGSGGGGGGKFLEVVITRDLDNDTYVPDTAFSVVYDAVLNSEPVSIIILDQGNRVPLFVQESDDPNKGDEPLLRFFVAEPGIRGTGLSTTMYIIAYEWRENDGFYWLANGTVSVTPES